MKASDLLDGSFMEKFQQLSPEEQEGAIKLLKSKSAKAPKEKATGYTPRESRVRVWN